MHNVALFTVTISKYLVDEFLSASIMNAAFSAKTAGLHKMHTHTRTHIHIKIKE